MLSTLGLRRAKLIAATVVVAALTAGCFGGFGGGGGGGVRHYGFPSGDGWDQVKERELIWFLNADRNAQGLPGLWWNDKLGGLAASHSEWMAMTGSFQHRDLYATINDPNYGEFWGLGENILVGSCGISAAQMHQAWMNSPGHRANILSPSYNVVGIHVVCGGDGRLWATQNFGTV
jgi:uncharacterized protein YkwD